MKRLVLFFFLGGAALAACGSKGGGGVSGAAFTGMVTVTAAAAPCSACTDTGGVTVAVAITSAGVSPNAVTVPGSGCGCVVFTNSDTALHQIESSPHPSHTDCPDLNSNQHGSGALAMGQSFTARMMVAGPMSCGWHDELDLPPLPTDGGPGY